MPLTPDSAICSGKSPASCGASYAFGKASVRVGDCEHFAFLKRVEKRVGSGIEVCTVGSVSARVVVSYVRGRGSYECGRS